MLQKIVRRVGTGMRLCGNVGDYVGLELARLRGGRQAQALRLRYKPDGRIWMRNATTDYPTLVSCFVQGYHRPLRALPPKPTIIDIGANVGYTLIDFHHRHPGARLVGVEMDEGNHALARRNVEGLQGIELVCAAIWREDGEVCYAADAAADAFTIGSTGSRPVRRVPALTPGTLMERCGVARADYVKLDIEGAESALFAAPDLDWLQRVDQLSVELHGTLAAPDLIALLRTRGFSARKDTRHWDTVVAWRDEATAAKP